MKIAVAVTAAMATGRSSTSGSLRRRRVA